MQIVGEYNVYLNELFGVIRKGLPFRWLWSPTLKKLRVANWKHLFPEFVYLLKIFSHLFISLFPFFFVLSFMIWNWWYPRWYLFNSCSFSTYCTLQLGLHSLWIPQSWEADAAVTSRGQFTCLGLSKLKNNLAWTYLPALSPVCFTLLLS